MFNLAEIDKHACVSRFLLNTYPKVLPDNFRLTVRGPVTEKIKSPFLKCRESFGLSRARNFVDIYEKLQGENLKPLSATPKLLEVGLGPGFIAERFQQRGLNVLSIDIDNFSYTKKSNVPLAIYKAPRLPFAEYVFDYISLTSVLHHISAAHHVSLFRDLQRVLTPHGKIFVQEDLRGRNPIEHWAIRIFDRAVSGPEVDSHRSNSDWIKFFQQNEFKVGNQITLTYGNPLLKLYKAFYLLTKIP